MRITVVAKPGSSAPHVIELPDGRYEVAVRERPERGKATDAVRRALANTLHVPVSRVSLVMGHTARVKVFEVR